MKKRTKTSLRTKIYLTLVALLALTGIIYATPGTPFTFSVFPGLTGVAATKSELFTTGFANPNSGVYTLDCAGIPTLYQASAPAEKYLAIAPVQSALAVPPFIPRDLFVTFGQFIFRATPPGPFMFFAQLPCSDADHTGITFDKVGTFGHELIATCKDGNVFRVDGLGTTVTQINLTSAGDEIEGPVVAPTPDPAHMCPGFGPFSGQILVADEANGVINAIDSAGVVTHNIFNYPGQFEPTPEALAFIPCELCTFCDFAFFQTSQQSPAGVPSMFAYPSSNFMGLGGSLLVTLESDQRILLVQFQAGNYSTSIFDNPPGFNILEGASFVDCDVPTPTPTATATFTPTPTATFTPTATATFTPTATATFTPTATATFTPTPTATATFTPTPTPTPTPQGHVSQITPTGTTCTQFVNGTAETLSSVNYSVSNGKIAQNVNPGVFFYWVMVTAPAGNNSFTITQTITTGNFTGLFDFHSGSNVFNSNCVSQHPTITQNTTTGAVTAQWNAPTAGTYIISIKYQTKSIVGDPAPSPGTTVHYDFATTGVPGSTSGLDLVKQ